MLYFTIPHYHQHTNGFIPYITQVVWDMYEYAYQSQIVAQLSLPD